MGVKQNPGESVFAYHKRLILDKVVEKTMPDMDYAELSEAVYGQAYSSDVARRMMYGSAKTLQLLDEERRNGVREQSELDELESKRIEVEKERYQLDDLRNAYRNEVRKQGRIQHIENRLIAAAENLDTTVGALYSGAAKKKAVQTPENDAVLVLSDWHYGMQTDNLWNAFNKEICRERCRRVVEEASERLKRHKCGILHIVILGDMIEGGIHIDSRVQSDELVADQIMQVSEILAQTIFELSHSVDKVVVHATYGNHGRVTANKSESVHRDNFERFIPFWIRQRLQNEKRILFSPESENEFLFFAVRGHSFCATHGDLDKPKQAKIKIPALYHQVFDDRLEYLLIGHWHSREECQEYGLTSFVCGSLCGTDDFANDKRLYSAPEQLMLIVNQQDGVDAVYHLKV